MSAIVSTVVSIKKTVMVLSAEIVSDICVLYAIWPSVQYFVFEVYTDDQVFVSEVGDTVQHLVFDAGIPASTEYRLYRE